MFFWPGRGTEIATRARRYTPQSYLASAHTQRRSNHKIERWDVRVPVILDLYVLAIRSRIHVTAILLSKPGSETLLKWVVSEN